MVRVVTLTFFVILGLITGCSSWGGKSTSRPGALDVAQAPIPSAEPVAAQPISDSQPIMVTTPVNNTSATFTPASSGSKSYTIKKGDTLFSIAKSNYGTGKDWQKIAAANPGLSPSKLKVGQTITIP